MPQHPYFAAWRVGSVAAFWVAASMSTGCDLYDIEPALRAADSGLGDGATDGAVDAGAEDDTLILADTCDPEAIEAVESNKNKRTATFASLNDDFRTIPICDVQDLNGPDGFIRFEAVAEERWTIAVEPVDENADVAMYVLPGCDQNGCLVKLDRCGAGIPEQFTFQAISVGTYFLGIDTFSATTGDVEVTMVNTVCGDGDRSQGEGCDDGNRMNGDGCDRNCRLEIKPPMDKDPATEPAREVEPNNWPTEANAVLSGLDTATTNTGKVVGRLGGACDQDFFVITVPDRADLRVTMVDGAELACPDTTPNVTMTLTQASTDAVRGEGSTGGAGGGCPSIEAGAEFAEDLPGGDYYITLAAERDVGVIDYHLQFEVIPPT